MLNGKTTSLYSYDVNYDRQINHIPDRYPDEDEGYCKVIRKYEDLIRDAPEILSNDLTQYALQ